MHIDHEGAGQPLLTLDRFPHYSLVQTLTCPLWADRSFPLRSLPPGRTLQGFPMMRRSCGKFGWLDSQVVQSQVATLCSPPTPSTSREKEALSCRVYHHRMAQLYRPSPFYARKRRRHNGYPISQAKMRRTGSFLAFALQRYASEKHPLGIFHPHAESITTSEENIRLIEVMEPFSASASSCARGSMKFGLVWAIAWQMARS